MDYQIKGKMAFVTAGAQGIWEAIANLLAQEGVDVIVADHNEAALKEKGGAWRATFAANLATAEGMDAAISRMVGAFGRAPDILVNNLGVADPIPFESFSDEQRTRAVDINLMGCVRTSRALLPRMAALGSASVVNIASDLAKHHDITWFDVSMNELLFVHGGQAGSDLHRNLQSHLYFELARAFDKILEGFPPPHTPSRKSNPAPSSQGGRPRLRLDDGRSRRHALPARNEAASPRHQDVFRG